MTPASNPEQGATTTQGTEAPKGQKGLKPGGARAKPEATEEAVGQEQKAQGKEAPSTPQAKALRRNFPKPEAAPEAKQSSSEAITAGEEACKGLTPAEVKQRFYSQAKSNLDPDQIELIEELPKYEAEAPNDPSFVAGQIAATIYSATLPAEEGQYGFQGCVYSLALGVE